MTGRVFKGLIFSKPALTNEVSDRVNGGKVMQGDKCPKGYYRTVSQPREYTFDGMDDLQDVSLDLFLYAKTETELQDLVNLFETELDDQSGTYNDIYLYGTTIVNVNDGADWSEEHNAYVGRIEIRLTIRKP